MTRKTRYLLIALGFVVFFVLAPIMVLYVRGIAYDPATNSFVKTGLLAVRSQPGSVAIFLDGKLVRTSQSDINFLTPGSYDVTLEKPGYQSWSKRLPVAAGQVTWANPANSYIYLFLEKPEATTVKEDVLDFSAQGDSLAYLTSADFWLGSVSNPKQAKSYLLPKSVNKILVEDSSGKNFALGSSTTPATSLLLDFDASSGKFYDLSGLFSAPPQLQFGPSGQLYALSNSVLYNVNAAKKTKTPLFSGVEAFVTQNNSLYFVQALETGGWQLLVSDAPFAENQILLSDLPQFRQGRLFVNFEKQILLLADGNLYLANSSMQILASGVSSADFGPNSGAPPVVHGGELDYYDSSLQNLDFITRSSDQPKNPVIKNNIDYAFYADQNLIYAIELDTRDSQNQYALYMGTALQKFFVDSAGKNILVLDGGILKTLPIR